MKRTLMFAVATAALAMCMSALAGSWNQPVDMTDPNGNISQVWETGTGDSYISADDWKCTDGQPINVIKWWGEYVKYEEHNPGPVDPPTSLQPIGFVLAQNENDASDASDPKPGAERNQVYMPLAYCHQTNAGTAQDCLGLYRHIFSYRVTLPEPWAQTKDTIYWLVAFAQFDAAPQLESDGFAEWDWSSTPPGGFLGTGHDLDFMGGISDLWTPIYYMDCSGNGHPLNFAFEIGTRPVDLTADKTSFAQSDSISVNANVAAISTPCYPFVRIIQPGGQVLYFQQGVGFVGSVTPFLGIKAGAVALPKIDNYPILSARFENMPKGTYYLEGGAVDPVTTDINNLQYVGLVSSTKLVIQ